MRPVDFFIVGQPKSGTTALASYLEAHPEICFSRPKEPRWMADDLTREIIAHHGDEGLVPVRTADQYESCFAHDHEARLRGEGSTAYLHSTEAAERIAAHNPHARIVVLLRNPVDLIHALHMEYVNLTYEDIEDFSAALDAETARSQGDLIPSRVPFPSALLYTRRGVLMPQLQRYWDTFGEEAVGVWTAKDLRDDPSGTYRAILAHIGARDVDFSPDFATVHEAKRPRSAWVNRAVRANWLRATARRALPPQAFKWVQQRVVEPLVLTKAPREPLSPDLRARLEDVFRPDVEALSARLGRDLAREWGFGESDRARP